MWLVFIGDGGVPMAYSRDGSRFGRAGEYRGEMNKMWARGIVSDDKDRVID